MKLLPTIALLTAILSLGSWTWRFIDEYMRFEEILFYILVPVVFWGLFVGPLFLLRSGKRYIRVIAALLLVPAAVLWALSVQIGIFGFRIH